MLSFSVRDVAALHNKVWTAHDRREFERLEESAIQMATEIGFSKSEKIGRLIKECYFFHSLLDDGKYNQISEIFNFKVQNRREAEKLIFRKLETKFEEIYTLSNDNLPAKQAKLQRVWWYYFSRKDIPEYIRLTLVSKPFFKQQMIKVGSKLAGIKLAVVLGRAGYYHNRDEQKTEEFLRRYWMEVKNIGRRFIMF